MPDGNNEPVYYSGDGGNSWSPQVPGESLVLETAGNFKGFCEESEAPQDPSCEQGVPSSNFESGSSVSGNSSRAVDIVLPFNTDFTLESMDFNILIPKSEGGELASFDAQYYTDSNGMPGELIGSQIGVIPTSVEFVNESEFINNYLVKADLDPVQFEGSLGENVHYWIRLTAHSSIENGQIFWETTDNGFLGYDMAYWFNDVYQGVLQATEGVYNLYGECHDHVDVSTDCGTVFYDTGGADGDYGNNENQTWHIIPSPGKVVSVEFTHFDTEEGMDGLMIYDGPDTTYPIISSGFVEGNETCPNGAWTGNGDYSAEGRTFISTHPSGIMTFVFTSNGSNTATGWEANVECVEPGSAGNCLPGELATSYNSDSTGLGAHMFDVTSTSDKPMEIVKFDLNMSPGKKKNVNVYYKPGTYEGYQNNPSAWTFLGSQPTVGSNEGTELKIGGLVIPAGETYGIYITIDDYVLGEGITFKVKSNSFDEFSNDKLTIHSGVYLQGGYFPGTDEFPAFWQGKIYYCEGESTQEYDQPCLSAEYGQYPDFTFEPGCFGYPEAITEIGWRGEYSKIMVSEGVEYIFSSSDDTDTITISDELGVVTFASGVGSVTWVSDFTGEVRFYTHTGENCGQNNSSVITKSVQCGELYVITAPDFDCYFGDGFESNFEAGAPIEYMAEYVTADDFIVDGSSFEAKQVRMNIISKQPVIEGRFNFLENDFGEGGEGPAAEPFLTTDFIEPSKQVAIGRVGTNFEYTVYEVTFDFPEPITFQTGTYWIVPEVVGEDSLWELTSTGSTGNFAENGDITGGFWMPISNMNTVFFISGDCVGLGVFDNDLADFTYYPNPVNNTLNLKSSNNIESVTFYNISGQKVLNMNPETANAKINMSSLSKGVYIMQVMINGSKKSFKIIKN